MVPAAGDSSPCCLCASVIMQRGFLALCQNLIRSWPKGSIPTLWKGAQFFMQSVAVCNFRALHCIVG